MNQEHQEQFGSKSHLRDSSQGWECQRQPQQHWELRLLLSLVLHPGLLWGCSAALLGSHTIAGAKKHQLKGLTFAQKEQTLPLLEAGSYNGCVQCSWLRAGLWLLLLISTINIFTQNGTKEHQTWEHGCCKEWRMDQNSMGNNHKPMLNAFF